MVKKRFDIVFLLDTKAIGFTNVGQPHYIDEPITRTFKGVAHTYLCTDKCMYSTNNLQQFDKEGGDKE